MVLKTILYKLRILLLLHFRRYEDYNAEYTIAKKDVTQYLGNPVNAFKIIKRLQIDWENTQRIIEYSIQMGKEHHHCKQKNHFWFTEKLFKNIILQNSCQRTQESYMHFLKQKICPVLRKVWWGCRMCTIWMHQS